MHSVEPTHDILIEHRVREFLKLLNSADGKPLDELSPEEARGVLARLQSSVHVDLPAAKIAEHTITQGGQSIPLTIVHPLVRSKPFQLLCSFMGRMGTW